MSDYREYTVLDGTNPTLDASDLFYEFEKARIRGANDANVAKHYQDEEGKIKPLNFTYVSSFRDPDTGTNPNSDLVNDAIMTDGFSIAFGTGHHLIGA